MMTVKFYYDYKSSYTRVAMGPSLDLERRYAIALRPIPFDLDIRRALGGEVDQRSRWAWSKVRYSYLDVRRFANEAGIIIRGPVKIFDSSLSLMGGNYAWRNGAFRPYSERVIDRFFKRELDIEDLEQLAAVAAEAGLNPVHFKQYLLSEGPKDLVASAREAERDGIFGVPTMVIEGEPFWGNDRLDWVERKLTQLGLKRQA